MKYLFLLLFSFLLNAEPLFIEIDSEKQSKGQDEVFLYEAIKLKVKLFYLEEEVHLAPEGRELSLNVKNCEFKYFNNSGLSDRRLQSLKKSSINRNGKKYQTQEYSFVFYPLITGQLEGNLELEYSIIEKVKSLDPLNRLTSKLVPKRKSISIPEFNVKALPELTDPA